MHELAVTRGMLEIVLESARKTEETRIKEITLVIGELSSIVDDSVQFYFHAMSEGTAAEGAKLYIRRIPALFECTVCKKQFDSKEHTFQCPYCGSDVRICKGGAEFYIDSIVADV